MFSGLAASLWFAATLFLGQGTHAPDMFKDVEREHWLYTDADRLARAGLLGWPEQGTRFRRPLTRYEFAVCFDRTLKTLRAEAGDDRRPSAQTDPRKQHEDLSVVEIEALIRIRRELRAEIAAFMPEKELHEIDRMLIRARDVAKARENPAVKVDEPLKDADLGHWATPIVHDLKKAGIITGYPDGYFRGKRAVTRNEMAAALNRLLRAGHLAGSRATDSKQKP